MRKTFLSVDGCPALCRRILRCAGRACAAPAGEAPAEEAAPVAESTCEGPLKFWTFEYSPVVAPLLEQYVAEWNASHEVQVEYQSFPWAQYTGEILTTGIATGEAPDVFFISPGDWRRYASGGLALPLNDYFPDYLKADLLPAALDAVTLDGNIYSVPFEMEPVVLWYNKEMLAEAGVAVPTSWEELPRGRQGADHGRTLRHPDPHQPRLLPELHLVPLPVDGGRRCDERGLHRGRHQL